MKLQTAESIPQIKRPGRPSKYDEVFDAAEHDAPEAVWFEDEKAGSKAQYMRGLPRAENFEIAAREGRVYVQKK